MHFRSFRSNSYLTHLGWTASGAKIAVAGTKTAREQGLKVNANNVMQVFYISASLHSRALVQRNNNACLQGNSVFLVPRLLYLPIALIVI